MNLLSKLLVIVSAATPLCAQGGAIPTRSATTLLAPDVARAAGPAPLYFPEAVEFRALIGDAGRLAAAAGLNTAPVCFAALPLVRAPAASPAAAPQPATAVERVFAGPVAAAHAGGMPRATAGLAGKDPLLPISSTPEPSGWKLFVCGFAILSFIALRKARALTG